MVIGCRWHAKFLAIPSELQHVMDDVESILPTCCRLLDAPEVSFIVETLHALPLFLDLDVATPHAAA